MSKDIFPQDKEITLESISSKKNEIVKQIQEQKELISEISCQLFAPIPSTSKMSSFMNTFNNGLAIYDGVMTGLKIIKRIKNVFRKKR